MMNDFVVWSHFMATAAIVQRLQKLGITLPEMYDDENGGQWKFTTEIQKKDTAFFKKMMQMHMTLTLEYSIHCARLSQDFKAKAKEKEAPFELLQDIEAALAMADLLEHLFEHYLDVPREVERLRRDQAAYHKLLGTLGLEPVVQALEPTEPTASTTKKRTPSTKDVRDFAVVANWPRFFFIRSRRLLLSIAPFFDENGPYCRFIGQVDPYVGPTLSYVAWMFFIPRLSVNLMLLAKHTIPGSWMGAVEKDLDWKTRLKVNFERRWFEVANDVVWFTGGLINCFILIGALAPYNVYFSVALQAYDVFLATVRTYIELGRLNRLKNDYLEMIKSPNINLNDAYDIQRHLQFLDQRIEYEQKRMNIGIYNNTILLLAMAVAVPYLVFNPLMPVFAAIVILTNTVGAYNTSKLLEKNKPSDKVGHLEFSPPEDPSHSPELQKSSATIELTRPVSVTTNKVGHLEFSPPEDPSHSPELQKSSATIELTRPVSVTTNTVFTRPRRPLAMSDISLSKSDGNLQKYDIVSPPKIIKG